QRNEPAEIRSSTVNSRTEGEAVTEAADDEASCARRILRAVGNHQRVGPARGSRRIRTSHPQDRRADCQRRECSPKQNPPVGKQPLPHRFSGTPWSIDPTSSCSPFFVQRLLGGGAAPWRFHAFREPTASGPQRIERALHFRQLRLRRRKGARESELLCSLFGCSVLQKCKRSATCVDECLRCITRGRMDTRQLGGLCSRIALERVGDPPGQERAACATCHIER